MSEYLVKDYMQANAPPVKSGMSMRDVVEHLAKQHVTGAAVVDEHKHIVGFISEQDCIQKLLLISYHCETLPVVDEVMVKTVSTVSPDDDVVELARRISTHEPKVFPVVENGKYIGAISRKDIMKVLLVSCETCYAY